MVPCGPNDGLHWHYEHWRAGKGAFTDEILNAGFVLEKELPLLPDHYLLVFRER